jgi:hypothetical protein
MGRKKLCHSYKNGKARKAFGSRRLSGRCVTKGAAQPKAKIEFGLFAKPIQRSDLSYVRPVG